MLVKLLVVLSLTAGMIQCKTSKVKSPQRPAGNGADAQGQSFEMPKFLLTQNSNSGANLNVKQGSVEVDPYVVGDTNMIVVKFAPEKPADAHYGMVRFCFDITQPQEQCFPELSSPLFLADFTPPKDYNNKIVNGAMSVQVRVCNGSASDKSSCGNWSDRVNFSISTPNPVSSDQKSLLDQRAANKQQLKNFVKDHLAAPAAKFKAAFEKKYEYPSTNNYRNASKEEQVLYTTAHNVERAPWAMSAVYSSAILETMADTAAQESTGAGLALTDEGKKERELGEKTDITNALRCDAAGYIWVNKERACYQPKKEEDKYSEVKIHKRWTNATAVAGEVLIFGALVGGATWKTVDYIAGNKAKWDQFSEIKDSPFYKGLDLNERADFDAKYIKAIRVDGGRFSTSAGTGETKLIKADGQPFRFGKQGEEVKFKLPDNDLVSVTRRTAMVAPALAVAAIVGTILLVDGATGYGLANSKSYSYEDHFKAFKGSIVANSQKLAKLKNTQCDIEKQLFGTQCN
ncbi:MAG: hypothetical protein AB8G05_22350 [Oligoflexales bacterium]